MKIKSLVLIVITALLVVNFSSCNSLENLTNSSMKLILHRLQGLEADGTTETDVALSDVMLSDGTVINDNALAFFTAVPLDPTATTFSAYQNTIIDQIDIEYSRGDRSNPIPGVDVPFPFSQKTHFLLEAGEEAAESMSFIIVPHYAKSESPLVELVNAGQEFVLKLEAKITFYSKDVAGNRLEPVVGYLSIWCANFADDTGN
jgi:hypothetical protein